MKRMSHTRFLEKISQWLPQERIYTDELRRLAWGTDAGFYRLIPQLVIRSENETEISRLLATALAESVPVTFRAAGTSLSGQSITDSVLIVAGKHWEKYSVSDEGKIITMQPGLVGGRVNEILRPYGRKLGPDPASVQSAMMGGILMNNASGMNCGIHANSDRMLRSLRMVLVDGTVLDTGDAASRAAFQQSHPHFLQKITELREKIANDPENQARLRKKYAIKNVVGLNLLPFLKETDPFEILAHLMVGSEGTLAFVSEMTMTTEYDFPCKASAMLYFQDLRTACRAVVAMKAGPAFGAEMLDKKSLASVNDTTGENLTAVLTETMAATPEELAANIRELETILRDFPTVTPVRFTDDPKEYAPFWKIRSGIFPSVGGMREPGTTCMIEDVAFPVEVLPEATLQLQELLAKNGYTDACIYGHALEGNYHFIINQKFDTPEEVARYERLMRDVLHLVVDQYDGSLKAEHGTGRNMAPFVRYEWGETIYGWMKEIKELFDPRNLLNPGVIFNDNPQCHLQSFKPLPRTNPVVDQCIECGFCEVNCVTCGLTLSSRQRIVIQREISRLERENRKKEAQVLRKQYRYAGEQTCAGDGLCSMSCPMGINVGDLTHLIREVDFPAGSWGYRLAELSGRYFSWIKPPLRLLLTGANVAHTLLGSRLMGFLAEKMHRWSGKLIPLWTSAMPKPFHVRETMAEDSKTLSEDKPVVVYFPSCINQTFGTAKHSPDSMPLVRKTISLLHKAGYQVIFPPNMEKLCCGMIWESKGIPDVAQQKTAELQAALWEASRGGKYPILCDQSPCLYRMRHTLEGLELYEPVEFISKFLAERLEFHPIDRPVALHITCSSRKMALEEMFVSLAKRCSRQVLLPEEVGCCGFAGDKGFTNPEINRYALRKLPSQLETAHIEIGYSNSRTCEIGLTTNSGIPYLSIVYLVDECTVALPRK
ncbi:MAG: FAD-binding and (Fe-S)-binding domain-containing protein [Planctomycetia bacterium]|nr:FAD-binding and (Fe-S)-binding domain-containing protein [Planctomycetia bacterium]